MHIESLDPKSGTIKLAKVMRSPDIKALNRRIFCGDYLIYSPNCSNLLPMTTTYIHMRDAWPEFRWNIATLTSILPEVRHQQGRLLGQMEGLGFRQRDEANLIVMTTEVVKSSAIEGEALDDRQVRSSLASRLNIDIGGNIPISRAVEGVVEMLIDATQRFKEPLTKERLCGWHAALFPTGYGGLRKITVGDWRPLKAGPMQVVSGRIGHEIVHFEAPQAERLPGEMKAFFKWFNSEQKMDAVIKAALAHLWFVTIHPFEDGNGRIARAIAEMALARCDGIPERFYSMSAQINVDRKEYYNTLEKTQRGEVDITDWLLWFIGCLERSLNRSQKILESVIFKARIWQMIGNKQVNDRQRKIINRLLGDFKGNLTTSKYAKMTHCSNDTALRDIRDLLTRGILLNNPGGGRSTSYRLGDADTIKQS